MSTRTTTTKSSTSNNRGRGQSRGGRQNNNNSRFNQNKGNEDMDGIRPYNERRGNAHNRGNYHSANRGNFRGNNNSNVRSNISDHSERSLPSDSNSDRIPRHLQNPFFVGELMSRFNNMVPAPSFLMEEATGSNQPEINTNVSPVSNIHTLNSPGNANHVKSDSSSGSSKNSGCYKQNGRANHDVKRLQDGVNWNQGNNHLKRLNEGQPLKKPSFDHVLAGSNSYRESENIETRNNSNSTSNVFNASVKSTYNKRRDSKPQCNSDGNKTFKGTSSREKRLEIMKNVGFISDSDDENSGSTQSKDRNSSRINQPPWNFNSGLIADTDMTHRNQPPRRNSNSGFEGTELTHRNQPPRQNSNSGFAGTELTHRNQPLQNPNSGLIANTDMTHRNQPLQNSNSGLIAGTDMTHRNQPLQNSNSGLIAGTDMTHRNQPQQISHRGLIADRASPRVRFNLEQNFPATISYPNTNNYGQSKLEPGNQPLKISSAESAGKYNRPNTNNPSSQNVIPLPVPEQSSNKNVNNRPSAKGEAESKSQTSALSDSFFSLLDVISSSTNAEGDVGNSSNSGTVKKQIKQETNKNKPPQNSGSKFNPFLKSGQTKTSQDQFDRSSSLKQRRQRQEPNNHSEALFDPYPIMTERNVAGRNHFNVHRPARDVNERVPTREEALDKIEQEYQIQKAEFEAKQREKEAKKREQYLAKYKHVDQGHRLSEGLLDEAAGYAPGYNYIETEEEVRQRQQEELRQHALMFQERQRQEQERERKKEEDKIKKKLEKNKHIDAGYRLGHGNNQGMPNSRQYFDSGSKNKQPKRSSEAREPSKPRDFNPELLLEGETEEEALQRQEEQLILEMILQEQMELQAQNKPASGEDEISKGSTPQNTPKSANSVSMNPFLSAENTPKTPNSETARTATTSHLNQNQQPGLPRPAPRIAASTNIRSSEINNNNVNYWQLRNVRRNVQVEPSNPPPTPEQFGMERQNSPQSQHTESKFAENMPQIPTTSQMPPNSQPVPKKPASCSLKNKNGAVLVLRPTPEDLNRALARKLEVQDEVDKLGYSAHYQPTAEQAPVYSNNRFERRHDVVRPSTGAIPKNTSSPSISASKPEPLATADAAVNIETSKQDEPVYDHKAELMAARLKFQQRYEEALKKKQEQRNES